MIFKRRSCTALLVLLCGITVVKTTGHDDFKFDSDDLQIVNSDPLEAAIKPPSRELYTKDVEQCPSGESKMMLTLLMQSFKWSDISDRKKEKAIKKLSRFFLVPKELITADDIHSSEIYEMLKHSINKSNNLLKAKDTQARVEFMIGCGDKMFANGKSIAHQINNQAESGVLEELSGLPLNWWNIWSKHVKSRVQRIRRQTDGGSGDGDDADNDAEYEYGDDEEPIDEPAIETNVATSPPHVRHNQIDDNQTGDDDDERKTEAPKTTKPSEESESNYDDLYDDEVDEHVNEILEPSHPPHAQVPTTASSTTTTTEAPTTVKVTEPPTTRATEPPTTIATIKEEPSTIPSTIPSTVFETSEAPNLSLSTESPDYDDESNQVPRVEKRIQKTAVTAGKPFSITIDQNVFYDEEDKYDLKLELLDKQGNVLQSSTWIRFNSQKREIYGLPLDDDVSRYEFKLRATDSSGEFVDESVEITVQQHKGSRNANHEIIIQISLLAQYESPIDWQTRLIRGIVEAVGGNSLGDVVVREIRPSNVRDRGYTFVYTNETMPKNHCPKAELEELMKQLTKHSLNQLMDKEIHVRSVEKDLIGPCQETTTHHHPHHIMPPSSKENFPPTVKNPIDRISAVVGQLLTFKVPMDTFYDPEDFTDLKMSLVHGDDRKTTLEESNWLQFDAKNQEFYGVPSPTDVGSHQYILVAEDRAGLKSNDALVVEVTNLHQKQRGDYGATFEYELDIKLEQFQNSPAVKRKFIERIANIFHDSNTDNVIIKSVKKIQYVGRTSVVIQNATLYRAPGSPCPESDIKMLKSILLHKDSSIRDAVKSEIGSASEFNVQKINVAAVGKCLERDPIALPEPTAPAEEEEEAHGAGIGGFMSQDMLITYVLPAVIILLMLLIALLIAACLMYKRRNTGKMELGDDDERRSFRSKGIPVIFQDELDEKPEIVTKSPIIMKEEKPPLLPRYGNSGVDDHEDVDEYHRPQPISMGNRESRGKSPVTPSYRKPPPYVSP